MRRRNLLIAAGVAAVVLAFVGWKVVGGGGSSDESGAEGEAGGEQGGPAARRLGGGRGDGALGQVRGRVLDAADRKPVAGVDVTFGNALGESTATSGADGAFGLDLAPGSYRVQAMGDGVFGAAAQKFALRPGQQVDGYDLFVSRLAVLHGVVVDHRGAVVAGARVTFSARLGGKPIGSEQTAPIGEATTDDAGRFEIEVLSGDVKLIAEAGDARGEALVGAVVPGQEPPEVTIRLAAGAAVDGRVVDAARAPVGGAEVQVIIEGPDGPLGTPRTATTDGAGRFRFEHLFPGKAVLEAHSDGGVSPPVIVPLADGEARAGIELVLAGAAVVAGRVVDGKGKPVAGATVQATPAKSKLKPRPVTTGDDGRFQLEGLAAGSRHVIQARKDGYAAAFARNVLPPSDKLELVLQSAGGIRGLVKGPGGKPVASYQVQVERYVSADGTARPGRAGSRFSSKDGRFELDVVEPGQYDLVISADGLAPARPPRVAVPPDGWAEVEVELSTGAAVAGKVTSGGAPLAGARVAMPAGYEGPPVFSDAQGRFKLVDVAPGTRSISASKAGLVSAHRDELVVRPGETVEVELALAASNKKEGGIGVALSRSSQGRPMVLSTVPRGPGYKAGVRKKDIVLAIDGITGLNLPVDQAGQLLRGPVGTAVRLEVEREGRVLRFSINRAPE